MIMDKKVIYFYYWGEVLFVFWKYFIFENVLIFLCLIVKFIKYDKLLYDFDSCREDWLLKFDYLNIL